jgi:PAS domain S-box-containing protein
MEPDSLKNQNRSSDENLSDLASFPERNPNPITEVDLEGQIYYLNPAARELFPDLPDLGREHPWLSGLEEFAPGSAGRPFPTREVLVRGGWYLQSIYYVAELNRLRLYGTDITERKRMEKALQESEARYRGHFDNIQEMVGVYQVVRDERGLIADRVLKDGNPAFLRTAGVDSLEQIRGQTAGQIFGQAYADRNLPVIRQVMVSGRVQVFESHRETNGRDYITTIQRLDPDHYLATGRDITELKRVEEALRESRDDLNRAQAVAHTGSWRMDIQRNELLWSEENHRIFGIPQGTPLNYETFLGTVHPDDRSEVDRQWLAALGGKPYDIEHRIVVDGRIKWVRERANLEFDADGNLLGGFGTTQDITELKGAEERLTKSETRFRLLSETAGALLASPSPQRVVEELCTRVMEHLDCQVFFNFLVDEPRGRLHLNAWAGIPEEEARKMEWLEYGAAVCGCVAQDRQRIVAEDIFHLPDPRTDRVRSFGVQAYACHPLVAQDRLLGTLSFGTRTRSFFSALDLELMKTVTDQVAAAMEKMRLLEAIRTARDELELRVRERTVELEKANEHLAEQSRILESFFKDTITPLVLLDRDFNFIRVNEAYALASQRGVADFPGHNHFEYFPHEENEAIFRQVVKTGSPYQALAKPFSFPDHPEWGVTYWDWILTPLPDDRGETAFLVFSLEEVTDRQVAEEALRKSERQLRTLADQLLYAQENERKRIARDMHDSLGASLSALKYKLEDLAHTLPEKEPRQIEEILGSLIPIIQETIGETRRMQNDLRPPLLDDLGILPTLTWFSRQFQTIYSRIAIEQRLEVREEDVPERLKVVVFRIIQEALNNIGKHARATQIRIFLGREEDRLRVIIRDNGMGFDTKRLPESADHLSGMGLSSMKERAELSGGLFTLQTRPEQGTAIEVSWPLPDGQGR